MNLRNFNALQFSRWLMGFGVFGVSLPARAAERNQDVQSFHELTGADLLTLGQSGMQMLRLADGQSMRVALEDLYLDEDTVFISAELAVAMELLPGQLGKQIDLITAQEIAAADHHGTGSMIASTVGTVGATLIVSSAMDELSDDLFEISSTALDAMDEAGSDAALDADEDATILVNVNVDGSATAATNEAPEFGPAPTDSEISESAAVNESIDATVQATDPEGQALTYTISTQDISGAFAVDAITGLIRVADPAKLNFETHESLNVTIKATDSEGATAEQTVTVALLDDPTDTIDSTPTNTVTHTPFTSGALVVSVSTDTQTFLGHAGVTAREGGEEGKAALIELFTDAGGYFNRSYVPVELITTLRADPFDALFEINTGEMMANSLTLTSTLAISENTLMVDITDTDFADNSAIVSSTRIKTVDRDMSGEAEETYSFVDGTVSRLGADPFSQTTALFDLSAGDIIHFADLTGDGQAELIFKQAGVGEAQVYENLGNSFATTPLDETIFTGIDLDDLAGGRLLDLSVREHLADGNVNVMLLGLEDTFLYGLT